MVLTKNHQYHRLRALMAEPTYEPGWASLNENLFTCGTPHRLVIIFIYFSTA